MKIILEFNVPAASADGLIERLSKMNLTPDDMSRLGNYIYRCDLDEGVTEELLVATVVKRNQKIRNLDEIKRRLL